MNIKKLSDTLAAKGFANVSPGNHFGVDFDIVGRRKKLAETYVLIIGLLTIEST